MKGGGLQYQRKSERKNVKDEDSFTYLLNKNRFVKINKLEFNLDKAIEDLKRLKKDKLLLS
jgi:hypothetical protein